MDHTAREARENATANHLPSKRVKKTNENDSEIIDLRARKSDVTTAIQEVTEFES